VSLLGYGVVKVMPEFKRRRLSCDAENSDEDRHLQANLELLIGVKEAARIVADHEAGSIDAKKYIDDTYGSAKKYNVVKGLDNGFTQSGHGGLASWKRIERCCALLGPTELRYEIVVPAWDSYDAPVWKRTVVKDFKTGLKRFEVPSSAGVHSRPLLVLFADQDAGQIATVQDLIGGVHLRMWLLKDPFHRYWRNVLRS
jgi:hypothetical protein